MAATNKCLAQNNKSRHASRATKDTNGQPMRQGSLPYAGLPGELWRMNGNPPEKEYEHDYQSDLIFFASVGGVLAGTTAPAFTEGRDSSAVRRFIQQNPPPGPRSDYVVTT